VFEKGTVSSNRLRGRPATNANNGTTFSRERATHFAHASLLAHRMRRSTTHAERRWG
jgi:hypothetical protein